MDDAGGGCQHQYQGDFEEQPLPRLRLCIQTSPASNMQIWLRRSISFYDFIFDADDNLLVKKTEKCYK
jgi:hypothetical protein